MVVINEFAMAQGSVSFQELAFYDDLLVFSGPVRRASEFGSVTALGRRTRCE